MDMSRAYRRKVCVPFRVNSCVHSADRCAYNCDVGDEITEENPLRPLTSLKWPYVPEESAYPDPLKRDDPKALQTAQYEAIGSGNLHLSYLAVSNQSPKPGVSDVYLN
jgi:hypothetical protein